MVTSLAGVDQIIVTEPGQGQTIEKHGKQSTMQTIRNGNMWKQMLNNEEQNMALVHPSAEITYKKLR